VEPSEVLEFLIDLSRETGLEVRRVPARLTSESEQPARSGVCRVRGRLFVLLAAADSVEDRIAALASGLRALEPSVLEGRWLPPAVRERLDLSS
jgi:hypothetical protein